MHRSTKYYAQNDNNLCTLSSCVSLGSEGLRLSLRKSHGCRSDHDVIQRRRDDRYAGDAGKGNIANICGYLYKGLGGNQQFSNSNDEIIHNHQSLKAFK